MQKKIVVIVDGFDTDSPLVCEGVVGDGCGGGRIFHIRDEKLFAYDPHSKEEIELLDQLFDAKSLSKSACMISVVCLRKRVTFDLSKFSSSK